MLSLWICHCSVSYLLEGMMLVGAIESYPDQWEKQCSDPFSINWSLFCGDGEVVCFIQIEVMCLNRYYHIFYFNILEVLGESWELPNYCQPGTLQLGQVELLAAYSSRRWILCCLWTLQAISSSGRREGAGQRKQLACMSKYQDPHRGLNFTLNWFILWELFIFTWRQYTKVTFSGQLRHLLS